MLELRPYQRAAIDGLYDYWSSKKGDNPLIVSPTGSGKSLIIAHLVKDAMSFPGTRVLVLTHVKELLEQGATELLNLYREADVGFYSASLKKKMLHRAVTFAGIQSIHKRAFDMIPPPDLVIVDECHLIPRSDSTRYNKFLSDLKLANPAVKIVGLTATPYRLDSGWLHKGEGAIFDGIAYDIPVADLMEQGFLAPVVSKAGARKIDLSEVGHRGGEFIESELAKAASDPELVRETVAEIVQYGADRKAWLIFACGVIHANMIRDEFQAHGIEAHVVTGADGMTERAEKIERFRRGAYKCLINVNVLTTGFNVPHVDLIGIVRATESAGLYVQIVGRGTRLAPGKTDCLAEGQKVLTNHGLIPIEDIELWHKLWDGVEWVSHDGVICKGEKEVITYDGITATPDHKCWTPQGWKTIRELQQKGTSLTQTGDGWRPIKLSDDSFRKYNPKRKKTPSIYVNSLLDLRAAIRKILGQYSSWNGWMPEVRTQEELSKASSWRPEVVVESLYSSKAKMHKPIRLCMGSLRRSWNKILLQVSFCNGSMDNGQHSRVGQSLSANRSHRQQFGLSRRQFADGECFIQYEQPKKKQPNATGSSVYDEIPKGEICSIDTNKINRTRVDGSTNCREMEYTKQQTKRRVWDIINAGPRNRFTCEGKLVSNCLVLDYGDNVMRHGFIDKVKPKIKSKSDDGEAPCKECPSCQTIQHAAMRNCVTCGYAFPPPVLNHGNKAYSGAMISTQVQAEWVDVDDVGYSRWRKEGKPDSIRVTYYCGLIKVSEWLCPDHGGYAAERYIKRMAALGATATTTEEAITECDTWIRPSKIKVKPNDKFYDIVQLDYSKPQRITEAERAELMEPL